MVDTDDNQRSTRWITVRLISAGALLICLLGVVGWRAYRLQADEGPRLRAMAEQQYLKEMEIPPRRGTIYDRNEAALALSADVASIYVNPRMIRDVDKTSRQLAELLELDRGVLRDRLRSSRRFFLWVKRRVSERVANEVAALKIRGVMRTKESRRFYPNQGLGGMIVGFAGLDARGLEGLELSYDGLLRGNRQRIVGLRDALGRPVFSEGQQQQNVGGHDLVLAIDKFIQYETEQALNEAYKLVRPKRGWVAAVVMDPRNGDLLAMASRPSFNPNRYSEAKVANRRNRTITDTFEPGSTIKPMTIAGAMDLGLVRPSEVFNCERGRYRVGRHIIHDSKPYKTLNVAGILKKSSNIGATKIAFRLGKRATHETLRKFGFASSTGINLPGERVGVLRSPKRWSDIGLANIAFGQGMTATVLQIVRAYSAIANGGKLMRPRLVLRVRDARGETVQTTPVSSEQVIRRDVADAVRQMLVGVTEEGGTAEPAALDHYTVAGKTGTAQMVDPVTGTYSKDRWLASFVGIAPASEPRLVIAVVANEPEGKHYHGGDVAGPVFKRIASKALRYLGAVADRRPPAKKKNQRPDQPDDQEAIPPVVATPERLAPPLPGERGTGAGPVIVPDFTGMSMAEVLSAAREAKLRIRLEGSGRAVAQSPGPGRSTSQTICRVSFSPPG